MQMYQGEVEAPLPIRDTHELEREHMEGADHNNNSSSSSSSSRRGGDKARGAADDEAKSFRAKEKRKRDLGQANRASVKKKKKKKTHRHTHTHTHTHRHRHRHRHIRAHAHAHSLRCLHMLTHEHCLVVSAMCKQVRNRGWKRKNESCANLCPTWALALIDNPWCLCPVMRGYCGVCTHVGCGGKGGV